MILDVYKISIYMNWCEDFIWVILRVISVVRNHVKLISCTFGSPLYSYCFVKLSLC